MPSVQKFYEDNKDRGLHVFLVNSQAEPDGGMQKYADDKGLTFPIPMARDGFDKYPVDGLPTVYVIGPDGKIAFEGHKGYLAVCSKQLDRIKYQGLGKLDVAKECVKAATEFGKGNYSKALAAAKKVKEKQADNETVLADAQFIIDRVNKKVEGLQAKVEAKKDARRYHEAVEILSQLAGKAFKGMDCSDAAADELKTLKKNKDVKAELKAWAALEKVLEGNKKAKNSTAKRKNLFKFYEKNEGKAAADEAKALADKME